MAKISAEIAYRSRIGPAYHKTTRRMGPYGRVATAGNNLEPPHREKNFAADTVRIVFDRSGGVEPFALPRPIPAWDIASLRNNMRRQATIFRLRGAVLFGGSKWVTDCGLQWHSRSAADRNNPAAHPASAAAANAGETRRHGGARPPTGPSQSNRRAESRFDAPPTCQ